MAIVADLSGNRPNNAPWIDRAQSSPETALRPDYSATQVLAFTGTSAGSAPFGDTVHTVRIVSTAGCFYRTGSGTLTAVATDSLLPAGVVEYIDVNPGDRIAAIQTSAGGNLHITPMNKKAA